MHFVQIFFFALKKLTKGVIKGLLKVSAQIDPNLCIFLCRDCLSL